MTGGSKIVGLFGDPAPTVHLHADPLQPPPPLSTGAPALDDDLTTPPARALPIAFGAAALLWVAFVIVAAINGYRGRTPGLAELAGLIATAAAPLALIGVVYLLLAGRSRRLARHFAADAAAITRSADAIEARINLLSGQAAGLDRVAADSAARLDEAAARLAASLGAVEARGTALAGATGEADRRLTSLLEGLPRADARARALTAALEEANLSAAEGVEALSGRLGALCDEARGLETTIGTAAGGLAGEVERLATAGAESSGRVADAARAMTETADAALERAATAIETTRAGIAVQADALAAMAENARAAIARTGETEVAGLKVRIDALIADVDALAPRLTAGDEIAAALVARLSDGIGDVERRVAALDTEAYPATERLGSALAELSDRADRAAGAIANGASLAETTIARSDALLAALDAAAREIDETLPAALGRLDAAATAAQARLGALAPSVGEAAGQGEALAALLDRTDQAISGQREGLEALAAFVTDIDRDARELVDGSGPALVEMMVRVREASAAAAERARDTIGRVVPDLARAVATAGDETLVPALAARVEEQMTAIAESARRAADVANQAVGTLAARAADADAAVERLDRRLSVGEDGDEGRAGFASRVSRIIEGLNAAAIDIAGVLSGEAGDAEWRAYREGDHAAFTRKAAELVGAVQARDLDLRVAADATLRGAVNRFVHDFETMLRAVVATREGAALGVTLLSSDIGKLYAALVRALDSRG